MVLRADPQPDVVVTPPLLIVEILSPDDTYSDQERCEDYLRMGVQTIWLIDPATRSGRLCTAAEWIAAEQLEVPGTPIHVELAPLFAQIQPQSK